MSKPVKNRGNYRRSQESDLYAHRVNTSLKVARYLGGDGVLTFGKFSGQSILSVPPSYLQWACESIAGFEERYKLVSSQLRRKAPVAHPSPRLDQAPERAPQGQEGPSEAQERTWKGNDDDPVPSFEAGLPSVAP
jgi:hypothetical protein